MREQIKHSVAVVCLVAFLTFGTGWAQRTTGSLGGTVQDTTGALLPSAEVTVTNESTGVPRRALTSEAGTFVFQTLPPANYTVRIEMPGFQAFEQSGIEVLSARDVRQRFTLQVGEVTETVTVQGGSIMVDTVGSEQRVGLTQDQVSLLPNPNRNITNLLVLNPAVTIVSGRGNRRARLNGMGGEATTYTMDGVEASGSTEGNIISQYQGRNNIDLISTEGIGEVQIVKGIVPAEASNTVSGQVNVISKSGTSEVHGSVFHLYQTHNLNGRNPFLAERPKSVYNQYGASVGFPILSVGIVDQSFGFFAWESYRDVTARRRRQDVPTQYARDRVLASPAFDDAEKQILQQVFAPIPLPNNPATLAFCDTCTQPSGGEFATQRAEKAEDDTFLFKTDLHFTDGSHLAFTYNRLDPDFNLARIVPEADREWHDANNRIAFNWNKSSTRWVFESRFGMTRIDQRRPGNFYENNRANVLGEETFPGGLRLPRIQVRGNGDFGTLPGETWNADSTTYNFESKIGYVKTNHHIKFGGSYRFKYGNRTNPEVPAFRYNSFESFEANFVDNRINYTFGEPNHNARTFMFGGFIQDDWKVTRNLTLNIGLRYDFTSNMTASRRGDTGERDVVFLNLKPPTDWNIFNFGDPLLDKPFNHDPVNFSPRLGFNWDMGGEGRTVIRGGFGMMTAGTVIGVWRDPVQDGLFLPRRQIFRTTQLTDPETGLIFTDGFRVRTLNQIARAAVIRRNSTGVPTPFTTVETTWSAPYSMNWTLGIQRELMQDLLFEVDYVGQRGVHLPMFRGPNEPSRQTGLTPNPELAGMVWYVDTSQQSFYNALQVNLRKRFSRSIAYGVTYAYGRSLAVGGGDLGTRFGSDNSPCCQDFFDPKIDRGRITGDVEHNFTGNWYWQLPGPTGGAARNILGGWSLSGILRAQTGTPISPSQEGCCLVNRPDLVLPIEQARFDDFDKTLQFWNPDAFAVVRDDPVPGANRPGSANRSLLSGPAFWTVDASLIKDFNLTEEVRLQFRWDLINAFNHINEGRPRSNLSGSRFGRIERIAGPVRTSQLNLKILF